MMSLIGLIALALVAFAAPLTAPYDPTAIDLKVSRIGPSLHHLLGTDLSGRDVLSRLIYGARVSLSVGVAAASISTTVGVTLGLTAGLFRGVVDAMVMRTTEVILSFPVLILLIVTAVLITPGAVSVVVGVGIFSWPVTCRIVRALVLSVREQDFVLAARAIGAGNRRLVWRHLLPMVVAPVIVATTLLVADAILLEAALSYLGFGIHPPQPSLGAMLNDAQDITVLANMPWLWLSPGLVIALTVLAVNLVGDALRDAFDPRQVLDKAARTVA
jgi:peptide/nickel transport system permease protein